MLSTIAPECPAFLLDRAKALPRVVTNPMQGAAAAGLLSQLAALVTFVTPLVWQPILQSRAWPGFIVVVGVAATAALLLFPRRSRDG